MMLKHKKLRNRLFVALGLLGGILLCLLLKQSTKVSEYVFARGISRGYITAVGTVSSRLPFSLFEWGIAVLVVLFLVSIVSIVRFARKRNGEKVAKIVLNLVTIVLSIALLYTMTASFAYNREPLTSYIPQHNSETTKEARSEIAAWHLLEYNRLIITMQRDENGVVVPPYDDKTLSQKLQEEYARLDDNPYFNRYTPPAKKLVFSGAMGALGIAGVSFQPTAEANVHRGIPAKDRPFLFAHEMAHSKGVMRERDADLLAAYITLTAKDDYIRYSGYANVQSQLFDMVRDYQGDREYVALYEGIHSAVWADFENALSVYISWDVAFFDDVGRFFNNLYLKLSGMKDGVQNYNPTPNEVEEVPVEGGEEGETEVVIVEFSPTAKLLMQIYYDQTAP